MPRSSQVVVLELQPFDARQVEMVGRFVEQQDDGRGCRTRASAAQNVSPPDSEEGSSTPRRPSSRRPHARRGAGADDNEAAMSAVAAQPLVHWGVEDLRRPFGDADLGVTAEWPEPAADAVVAGGQCVEDRDGGDALPINIEMSVGRSSRSSATSSMAGRRAERGSLASRPFGPGRIRPGRGAVPALPVPRGQPRRDTLCRIRHVNRRPSHGSRFLSVQPRCHRARRRVLYLQFDCRI